MDIYSGTEQVVPAHPAPWVGRDDNSRLVRETVSGGKATWSIMATISVTDARNRLPELVDDVASRLGEYVITKHGRAHAVLLSAEEHEALLETLEILSDSRTMDRIRRGLDDIARGETDSFEKVFGEPL